MDSTVFRKRLSTFRTDGGRLRKVSDDLTLDILRAWEQWSGTSKEFYKSLGLDKHQLPIIIKRGKKLIKSGAVTGGEFKELKFDNLVGTQTGMVGPIEVTCGDGRVIRFSQVDQLVDFIKKAA